MAGTLDKVQAQYAKNFSGVPDFDQPKPRCAAFK
jgi:hypothetical protein